MDWRTAIGLLAAVITVGSIIPYILDIFRGSTKPNIVTWFLWTLNGSILSYAQFTAGASWTLGVLLASTSTTAIVTVLAIRYGQARYGWIDGVCLLIAIGAIALWQITGNPLTAMVSCVVAEIFAASPTVVKAYRDPNSETPSTYWLTAIATALSIFASTKFDLANLLFPSYSILINSLIGGLAMRQVRDPRGETSSEFDSTETSPGTQ
jgi:hypothetical protein